MTRAFRIAGIATLLTCTPLFLAAQSSTPVTGGISGGISIPEGDLATGFESGYNGTLHVYLGHANAESRLNFRANLSFDKWKGKLAGVSAHAVGGSIDGLYYFAPKGNSIRPLVIAGAGLTNYKTTVKTTGTVKQESGSTRPLLQGGVGFEFNLAGFSTILEAKYACVFGKESQLTWIPISFGIHY